MGLYKKFFNQTRKPEGVLGKMMIKRMNKGHARLAAWGMTYLPEKAPTAVAELGCGGGKNAAELLKRYPQAQVTALDHAPLSVAAAREENAAAVAAGRCQVVEGDVSHLSFADGSFELATAFETIYFWPELRECFAEVRRVLRPGGVFMIVNESDGLNKSALYFETVIDGLKNYTVEQIEEALLAAGFSAIRAEHHPSYPWITVLAEA